MIEAIRVEQTLLNRGLTSVRWMVAFGAKLPIALLATRCPSKGLARSVAFVGEEAHAAGTGAAMRRDAATGCRGRLRGQPLPPQLLHAAADRIEIVSCSGP